MSTGPNRIDQTPVRMSTNMDVGRQTPKTDFGDRVKAGIDTTAGAVANGAAVVAPFLPGGAIVSAAVSSVSTMSNGQASGQGAGVSAQYASTGVTNLTGGVGGGINTTVGGGGIGGGVVGGAGGTTMGTVGGIGGSVGGVGQVQTGGNSTVGAFNNEMLQAQQDNSQLIQVQIQMQHENQVFSTISNVLKVRNDTVKNTIQNVH